MIEKKILESWKSYECYMRLIDSDTYYEDTEFTA